MRVERTITGADWARSLRRARPWRAGQRERIRKQINEAKQMELIKIEQAAQRLADSGRATDGDVRCVADLVRLSVKSQRELGQLLHDHVCAGNPALGVKLTDWMEGNTQGVARAAQNNSNE